MSANSVARSSFPASRLGTCKQGWQGRPNRSPHHNSTSPCHSDFSESAKDREAFCRRPMLVSYGLVFPRFHSSLQGRQMLQAHVSLRVRAHLRAYPRATPSSQRVTEHAGRIAKRDTAQRKLHEHGRAMRPLKDAERLFMHSAPTPFISCSWRIGMESPCAGKGAILHAVTTPSPAYQDHVVDGLALARATGE